jgi:hypothetical protein
MATFPYTPSFVHGETFGYAVQVNVFGDLSEQRYLRARQPLRRLSYEFARADSGTVAGIASWFIGHGGPRDTFTAVDHRDGSQYTVRFAAPTLEHVIGPILAKRQLKVDFIVDQGGATPLATTYVPAAPVEFCDPVVPTSGVVDATAAEPRDGWPWIGQATVTPTDRYLPVGGFGGPTSVPGPVETALPSFTSLVSLTMRVHDIGSAGSVQLAAFINQTKRAELVVVASASNTTVVVTGAIVTSAQAGTLACLVTSLGTALGTGPTIAWGLGYTYPY